MKYSRLAKHSASRSSLLCSSPTAGRDHAPRFHFSLFVHFSFISSDASRVAHGYSSVSCFLNAFLELLFALKLVVTCILKSDFRRAQWKNLEMGKPLW